MKTEVQKKQIKLGDRIVDCYSDGSIGFYNLQSNSYIRTFGQDSKGYRAQHLKINGKRISLRVHRLIAQAFIPNPSNLPEIDHINHDRADNRPENLRWCDRSTNMKNTTFADKPLMRKLTHEVIPAIARYGFYDPEFLKSDSEEKRALDEQWLKMSPLERSKKMLEVICR